MVELDHQDFADFVALQHRPASDQHLVRLAVGREIVLVPRQMRAEKRVAGEKQVTPFAVEDGGIVLVGHAGTADRLVMNETSMRGEHRIEPLFADPQAVIEIVVDDEVRLVEAAEAVEGFARGHQARAGQRDDVTLGARQSEIAGLVFRKVAEGMAALAHRRQEQAGMLDSPAGVEQQRTDRADLRALRLCEKGVEPVRVEDLDVVVQEQQEFALCRLHGEIVEARPVVRLGRRDDPVGIALQPCAPFPVGRRDILDADDLVILVGGEPAQCLDAGLDHTLSRAGRDDDRDEPFGGQRAFHAVGAGNETGMDLASDGAPLERPFERRLVMLSGIVIRFAPLAQHRGDVPDRLGLLGAAQRQIVIAVAQQLVRRAGDRADEIGAGAP